MIHDRLDIRCSLRSQALACLGLSFTLGCGDAGRAPTITGATNQGGPAAVSATAGSTAAAGMVAAAVSGAGGNTRASAAGASGTAAGAARGGAGGVGTLAAGTPALAASGGMVAAAGASAGSGAGTTGASAGGAAGATEGASATFPPVTDLGSDGPYMAQTEMNTGPGGSYTIYRPAELAPGGAKNPIVGWMSGGGSTPSMYTLLPHLATHGFVVVASNTAPSVGSEVQLGEEIIAGIDWILAENEKADSDYHDKLDPTKIASMGYSMGALATTAIGGDPRLTTTVHISGGNMVTDRIKMLHAPAAIICGASGADIAGANCATDFEAATVPVFYGVFNGGDHLGVRTPPYSDRIRLVVTGWLRWQLMSDVTLAPMFVGGQCTLCKDTNWTVKQKNLM